MFEGRLAAGKAGFQMTPACEKLEPASLPVHTGTRRSPTRSVGPALTRARAGPAASHWLSSSPLGPGPGPAGYRDSTLAPSESAVPRAPDRGRGFIPILTRKPLRDSPGPGTT
jgi:hypothetical protein